MSFDLYAEVTERIIEQLENGVIPWAQPWVGCKGAVSYSTGKPYSLLNQILIGKPGEYATFKQVQEHGGKVKKGAKSKLVVFWKLLPKDDEIVDGNEKDVKMIPYLRYYRVFNIDDCEGIEHKHFVDADKVYDNEPIEKAQALLDGYIKREGIKLEHEATGGAFYRPSADMIHLPLMEKFVSAAAYYETAFHECIHSTGAENRLNRSTLTGANFFGHDEYSKEELVAELGSCATIHKLGIETRDTFTNNAAYIKSWLKALKDDKRMLVGASSQAEKAVAFLFGE